MLVPVLLLLVLLMVGLLVVLAMLAIVLLLLILLMMLIITIIAPRCLMDGSLRTTPLLDALAFGPTLDVKCGL